MQKKDKGVVIPFWGGMIFSLDKITRNFGAFLGLVCGFSFLSAFLSMLIGRGYACGLGLEDQMFFCGNNGLSLILNTLFLFVFTALFIRRLWGLIVEGGALSDVFKMKFGVKDLKTLGFLGLFLFFWGVFGGCLYALYIRKATPYLNFELAWFVFVSLFILAALFMLANAVVFARFLDGKKWLVLNKTALPVFDNIYKLAGWFLFYLLLFAYLIRRAEGVFVFCWRILPVGIASFVGDFALFFVFYFMTACFVLLLKYQEIHIFADEKE